MEHKSSTPCYHGNSCITWLEPTDSMFAQFQQSYTSHQGRSIENKRSDPQRHLANYIQLKCWVFNQSTMPWIHSTRFNQKVTILIFFQKLLLRFKHHFQRDRFGSCKDNGNHKFSTKQHAACYISQTEF